MTFSLKSAKRLFPFSGFSVLLLCAGIFLLPLASGCSGKKKSRSARSFFKKKPVKKTVKGKQKKAAAAEPVAVKQKSGKTAAKSAKIAIPAVFTRLTSYEGISLDAPFAVGETEFLEKIDPARGIRVFRTERLPEGKIILDAATLRIIRLETKKRYETEKDAAAAFEARKTALEKSIGFPPVRGAGGVIFTEMVSDGRGRSLQINLSGSTMQEIISAQAMPRAVVRAGRPIYGLFGLTLGRPIPDDMINKSEMLRFYPVSPRDEFFIYNYFNDEMGNVQNILVKSDPDRKIGLVEVLATAGWLEETFAMKMSYEVDNAGAGLFRYSSGGRMLELHWQNGKLTLSARIALPDKKK